MLDSQTCLVTGASRGIGRAVAEDLGRHGAEVAVNYRSSDEAAREVVDGVEARGIRYPPAGRRRRIRRRRGDVRDRPRRVRPRRRLVKQRRDDRRQEVREHDSRGLGPRDTHPIELDGFESVETPEAAVAFVENAVEE